MINLDVYSKMFDEADTRIKETLENEKKEKEIRRKQIEELEMKRKELVKQNTENFANSIIALITDTLSNAKYKTGVIESVDKYKNLGKITTETVTDTDESHYNIDENGLTVILNYSRESYDMSEWGGKKYSSNNIDNTYLTSILNPMGIEIQYNERKFSPGMSYVDMRILTIMMKRPNKLDEDNNILKRAFKFIKQN